MRKIKRQAAPSSSREQPRCCRSRCWLPAAPAVWMFTAGWVHWRPTVLSSPTPWFALPCHATCAPTRLSAVEPKSCPGGPAPPCCSHWLEIYTRCPRDRMASFLTFISPTCWLDFCGSHFVDAAKRQRPPRAEVGLPRAATAIEISDLWQRNYH